MRFGGHDVPPNGRPYRYPNGKVSFWGRLKAGSRHTAARSAIRKRGRRERLCQFSSPGNLRKSRRKRTGRSGRLVVLAAVRNSQVRKKMSLITFLVEG